MHIHMHIHVHIHMRIYLHILVHVHTHMQHVHNTTYTHIFVVQALPNLASWEESMDVMFFHFRFARSEMMNATLLSLEHGFCTCAVNSPQRRDFVGQSTQR